MLDQIPLQLDREGIKEREKREEKEVGGGGRLFEGGDYFKIHQRGMGEGNYSREVINQGTAIIRRNTVRPCINNSSPDFASVRASGHLCAACL